MSEPARKTKYKTRWSLFALRTIPWRIKWWFFYRFHPRHRYHVVHTGLSPRYYDPATRMETAIVAMFMHWVDHPRSAASLVDPESKWTDDDRTVLLGLRDFFRDKQVYDMPRDELTPRLLELVKRRRNFWY